MKPSIEVSESEVYITYAHPASEFAGAFTPDGRPLPIKSQPSPLFPILIALLAIAFGSHSLGTLISGSGLAFTGLESLQAGASAIINEGTAQGFKAVLLAVLLPLTVGFGLLAMVIQNGKHLVNRPQLCPQLANTVRKVGSIKPKTS